MTEQPMIHSTARVSGLAEALTGVAGSAAREAKVITAERTGRAKLLAARDLRKLAGEDTALTTDLTRVTTALTGQDKASTAWQKRLAEATKAWQASLAAFAKLHPDAG